MFEGFAGLILIPPGVPRFGGDDVSETNPKREWVRNRRGDRCVHGRLTCTVCDWKDGAEEKSQTEG